MVNSRFDSGVDRKGLMPASVLGDMYKRQARATGSQLIDAVFDGYATWRERSAAVELAYRDWSRAGAEDRERTYALYIGALDREEHAAAMYRALVKQAALSSLGAESAPI